MKRLFCTITLVVLICNNLFAAKDPMDSFDNLGSYKVGIIVAGEDTSSAPSDALGQAWYNYFNGLGFDTKRIDTSYCNTTTYDGTNAWTTLDFAVAIPTSDYTTIVDIDTSTGIGNIPIIAMHRGVIDSLGLGTTVNYTNADSFYYGGDTTGYLLDGFVPLKSSVVYSGFDIYAVDESDSASKKLKNLFWAKKDIGVTGVNSLTANYGEQVITYDDSYIYLHGRNGDEFRIRDKNINSCAGLSNY